MNLIVAHYHLRPGGVRRVIEEGVSAFLRNGPLSVSELVVATGEAPDDVWLENFQKTAARTPVRLFIAPTFGYVSEQRGSVRHITGRVREAVTRLVSSAGPDAAVWFHNPGLGRNLIFVRELARACAAAGIPFIAHHHDWWFDNRWQRWPEFKRCGFRTLRDVAKVIFPSFPTIGHATINAADHDLLAKHCGAPVAWHPNPAAAPAPVSHKRIRAARAWLNERTGGEAPVWLLPCRMLRRKNIAEALLLARWLRPEAHLVTTGGASSADEQRYFDKLETAARQHRWPLHLAVMRGDERNKPSITALMAASEAVMLTSIQEGFGLPYIEAAASNRPLIARRLPNIAPDLAKFGFTFPYLYDDLFIHPDLYDVRAENLRRRKLFTAWRTKLPRTCQALTHSAAVSTPTPFSRLTLTAQIEVLAMPPEQSWAACAPLNPFLAGWRRAAATGTLRPAPWPDRADQWLGEQAYAGRFAELLAAARKELRGHPQDFTTQQTFIRERLAEAHLFPLLLATDT